jgi:diguanylate cyclase (GGDEF)-like protein
MRNRPQSMSGNSSRSDHGGNAVRDELTESFSRSYFVDAVGIERELALEIGKPFSICLMDIDQLKNVNDQFGIDAGDAVIAGVAESVRASLDLPQWQNLRCLQARFDGDSLILLLPGCRIQRAEQFAHVVSRRIGDAIYAGSIQVTVSMAVTGYKVGESIDELLARAERTMCLAKQFGGDAVETVRTPEPQRRKASVTKLPVAFRKRKRAG